MEQSVSERPLSTEKEINNRQTCSSGSNVSDTHLSQDPSNSWYPRRWTSRSSFRGDNLIQDKPVCRDFFRGKCARGLSCKYQHCESDSQEGYKFYVCRDFFEGRCNRVSCKLLHPDSDKINGCWSNGNGNLDAVAMDDDSRTRPFSRQPRSRSPCRKFLNGMCNRGDSCSYLHSEYTMHDRPRYDHSAKLQQGVAATSRNPDFGGRYIGNALHTFQEHEVANTGNDIGTGLSGEQKRKSPCLNFRRGRCYHGASCSYNHHLDTYLRSRYDGTLPGGQRLAATSEYPGFGEGSGDASRASAGHEEVNVGDGRSINSFSVGSRSRPLCRNFARGRCYRESHCTYSHLDTYVRSRDGCSIQQHEGIATSENTGFIEGGVGSTSRTSEEHEEAYEGNNRSTRPFSARCISRSLCRNFLAGRCLRGSYCSYLHHDAYVRPTNDCTQLHQSVARTSENPGFGEVSDGVNLRTYQEHDEVHNDGDVRSNYFSSGPRTRSPCRNFLSGRCYRGASCPYLHLVTNDKTRYSVDDLAGCEQNRAQWVEQSSGLDNLDITSRSWSSERQGSRPLRELGANKLRPEVCLRYCKGKCTLGESCKYLHSFHEYAKSASVWTKQPHFESDAATNNSEKPNIPYERHEVVVASEHPNLQCLPFKRWRSRSKSPFSPRDDFDNRKMRRDELQNNFNKLRSRSKSPLTQRDNLGFIPMRRDESQDNFPRDRHYNVAPFRYPCSRSYRYNGPRYYVNKEPHSRVAVTSVDPSSCGVDKYPNVMETLRHDEVKSLEMHLDQCPNSSRDSSSAIVNKKSEVDFVEDANQDRGGSVRNGGDLEITKGEPAVETLVMGSDSTHTCGENHSSPMDTNVSASNKHNHAEVKTDLGEGSEKIDEKQVLETYIKKKQRRSYAKCSMEPLSRQAPDPSTHGLPSCSAGEACLSEPEMISFARVSDDTQDVATIGNPVEELVQGNGAVTKEIQNYVESAVATKVDGTSVVGYSERNSMKTSLSSLKAGVSSSRRKLLVLDVNGLLADIVAVGDVPRGYKPDMIISMKAVFKRSFCDNFLEFCFGRFDVGVWSSRNKKNVERVVDFLMYNTKKRLLFCWDQAHCTDTGYKTIENRDKPLVLKELKKLWEKQETDLPWDKGFYDETNTILLDDSPYKALCNPPHTAIFPYAYKFRDVKDRSLGPGGDLRVYLEKLAAAENVQKFIQENPFGQRPITKSNLSWGFYSKIVGVHANQREGSSNSTLATKLGACASQQERSTDNSPASKMLQEGNANISSATKAVGAHTIQQEGNVHGNLCSESVPAPAKEQEESAKKTAARNYDSVYSDQQGGNAEKSRANQQEGNADNTTDTKAPAHANQLEGYANITHANSSVQVHAKENVDNIPESKSKIVGVCTDSQVGNTDNTAATEVGDHGSQRANTDDNPATS